MKYSVYNSVVPVTEKTSLIYNASSNRFILFQKTLEEQLVTLTPKQLEQDYPDLYAKMLEGGAIVENGLNEFEELLRISREADCMPEEYQLLINPTMDCNFRCWYCYETHIRGSKMDERTVENVRKHISKVVDGNPELKVLHMSFFGGEPLIYYQKVVQPIIDHASKECQKRDIGIRISFTTNGFLVNERTIGHLAEFKDHTSFQITLDGHREQHNKTRNLSDGTGSYDKIVENIKKLAENGFLIVLRVNYTAENLDSTKDILADFEHLPDDVRNKIRVSFHRVWQDDKVNKERDNDIDAIVDTFRDKFSVNASHYDMDELRFPCYADKLHEAIVNYNGDVFKCTARDFLTENRCGYLKDDGEIEWENDIFARQTSAKMKKEVCKDCRILPICGGGCSQKSIETQSKNRCLLKMNENQKDKVILHRFYRFCVK